MPLTTKEIIIRFDDFCPHMNFQVWDKLEKEIISIGVKPIIALVPNNTDKALKYGDKACFFWERMRHLQSLGWAIGLHGLNHFLHPFSKNYIKTSKFSEFSGLPLAQQTEMIRTGVEIFSKNFLSPDIWVAPSHGFDKNTLTALKLNGINRISDGYSALPYTDSRGMFWVPQRTWRLSKFSLNFSTVCLHINHWDSKKVDNFLNQITFYKNSIIDLKFAEEKYANRAKSLFDDALILATNAKVNINQMRRRVGL